MSTLPEDHINGAESGSPPAPPLPSYSRRLWEVVWAFLPLGWIAFGGPQAHIALMQERFVERKRWLDERRFVELLGLGQGLPGPTSTQMVVAVGTARAGPLGGLLAFFCFLYPAVVIMALAGLGVAQFLTPDNRPPWLDGVGAGAVALVASAAWRLGASSGDHAADDGTDALRRSSGRSAAPALGLPRGARGGRVGHGGRVAGAAPHVR